jgi:hypothetical protein
VTDAIFAKTKTITRIRACHAFPDVDLGKVGATVVRKGSASGSFPQVAEEVTVEVIDSVEDYGRLLARVFDFDALRTFLARPDFRMIYDALSGGACDGHRGADAGCSADPAREFPPHCPPIPSPNLRWSDCSGGRVRAEDPLGHARSAEHRPRKLRAQARLRGPPPRPQPDLRLGARQGNG